MELPSDDGGIPGARTGAGDTADRGRLAAGLTDTSTDDTDEEEEISSMNIETQTVKSKLYMLMLYVSNY